MPILAQVETKVNFEGLDSPVSHTFLVVRELVFPVIIGVDFLRQHGLSLDFTFCPVRVYRRSQPASPLGKRKPHCYWRLCYVEQFDCGIEAYGG